MNSQKESCEVTFTRSSSQEAEYERWTLRVKYDDPDRGCPVQIEVELDDLTFSHLMSSRIVTGALRRRILRSKKS